MDNQAENITVRRFSFNQATDVNDQVAIEEPMEIQLAWSTANGRSQKNIAVTMRTPGSEKELALGFLFTEGIIKEYSAVEDISLVSNDRNRILVTLKEDIFPELKNAQRNFYSTSSCGICGKASIDAIQIDPAYDETGEAFFIKAKLLYSLPSLLKKEQAVFENTGGLHACALFDSIGRLIQLNEDVGRHNALDKVIGAALLKGKIPLSGNILLLSGRASFELIQKAAMAGIKIVAAVGAPSSLAIELAKEVNITLAGFVREDRCNLYAGYHRVQL